MKPEFSLGASSPDGMVALALVTALMGDMTPEHQRQLLSKAHGLLPPNPAINPMEARRMVDAMLRRVQSVK